MSERPGRIVCNTFVTDRLTAAAGRPIVATGRLLIAVAALLAAFALPFVAFAAQVTLAKPIAPTAQVVSTPQITSTAQLASTVQAAPTARAQAAATEQSTDASLMALPEAPEVAVDSESSSFDAASADPHSDLATAAVTTPSIPMASPTQKYIEPGQMVPVLAGNDKVLLGIKNSFTLFAISGWFASAGYEQIVNGSPNYGTDRGAFGQRLGAAALRDTTESILSDSVMSNLFHEDPRYYRMGPEHNFFLRLVYAGTRPIITRKDNGRLSLNFSQLTGTLGGAALTNLYYPQANRGMTQTIETFGGSVGGASISDVVSEFYDDFVHMFHPAR